MANEPKIALRCENLHRYLGKDEGRVHVLKGVTFEAHAGSVYAIVGPSGCGKSTLLYLLGLLDQPEVRGRDLFGRTRVEDELEIAGHWRTPESKPLHHSGGGETTWTLAPALSDHYLPISPAEPQL